jgi:ABC-2 type transport system ATP-binding protein
MTEAENPAISINGISKIFPLPFRKGKGLLAVDNVSIRLEPGEIYGLIGPNGSGKSTTMKILLGLVTPTHGTSTIFGKASHAVESKHEVGFLPENPYFYKHLTGAETLRFYGRLCGLSHTQIRERTEELLDLVELQGARDRRLGGYSKGMLQRIGLAQALIHRPKLLVLDEPTAGVDPVGSRQIRDLILKLSEEGITVFLCSHLLEQVQEICHRVGIIFRGKLVREGTLEELISVEDQTEIILRNASPHLLDQLRSLVASEQTETIRIGKPRTTLERLFLDHAASDRRQNEEKSLS